MDRDTRQPPTAAADHAPRGRAMNLMAVVGAVMVTLLGWTIAAIAGASATVLLAGEAALWLLIVLLGITFHRSQQEATHAV